MVLPRERAAAHRTIRRSEKKIKELLINIDDERKQGETFKSDVSVAGQVVRRGCGQELAVQGGGVVLSWLYREGVWSGV